MVKWSLNILVVLVILVRIYAPKTYLTLGDLDGKIISKQLSHLRTFSPVFTHQKLR
jgi:hypothetical protein